MSKLIYQSNQAQTLPDKNLSFRIEDSKDLRVKKKI